MNFKPISSALLFLSIIILSPSLALAHTGHGEYSGVLHFVDHSGEVASDATSTAIWVVLAVFLCGGALLWRVFSVSHSVRRSQSGR